MTATVQEQARLALKQGRHPTYCTVCAGKRGHYLGTYADGAPACWSPCWDCGKSGRGWDQLKLVAEGVTHPETLQLVDVHELKTWPESFRAIRCGDKRYEIRKNDRDFKVDDLLLLREYDPDTQAYTGPTFRVRVTHMSVGQWGLLPDFCCMSIL